ncbi:hypothetical protein R3W88_025627 [Solanum pinnatisectum]|uniref:Uncharacterized protein n=1 Tax=Solanum pinnatisectum TaxID=50273 RepID=A0AAV9M441_9SOLN|nr:hypothetical protein R3W88_025627 [Solanum pinnatisectum]
MWWNVGLSQMVGLGGLISGLPCSSSELDHVAQLKKWVTWFLKWGGPREAGFTEQRTAPALSSGRITSQCLSSPVNA